MASPFSNEILQGRPGVRPPAGHRLKKARSNFRHVAAKDGKGEKQQTYDMNDSWYTHSLRRSKELQKHGW